MLERWGPGLLFVANLTFIARESSELSNFSKAKASPRPPPPWKILPVLLLRSSQRGRTESCDRTHGVGLLPGSVCAFLRGGRQIIDLISSALFLKCFWKHMTDLHIPATAHTGLIHCLLQRGMYWFINRAAYNTCSYFYFVFYARYGFCLYINKGGNSLYKEKFVIHCWQILLITWNKWAYCQHWQGLPLPTACIIALKKKNRS